MNGGTTLWEMLAQAGWTMVPLYVCSLAAFAVLLRKGIEFWRARVGRSALLHADTADLAKLARDCEAEDSPLGRVMATAARNADDPEHAEDAATRAATAELDRFDAWIPLLGFIAQVAPLFGLLGTVIGMVDLFGSMESAGTEVSTATLSAGIWKALLTTAAGLIVAIPALAGHLWLNRRLESLQRHMEHGVGRILDAARGRT
jgi:biopolymer transport protein ExbB